MFHFTKSQFTCKETMLHVTQLTLLIFFHAVLKIHMLPDLHKEYPFFVEYKKVKRNTEGATYCGSM
jgi:hypothetical protein